MLEKIKNWMDKPYTRGDVLKYNAYALGAYALFISYIAIQSKKYQKDIEEINEIRAEINELIGEDEDLD